MQNRAWTNVGIGAHIDHMSVETFSLVDGLHVHSFAHFALQTLRVSSVALRGNPLGDPTERTNPVLVPKTSREDVPVVLILAGFTGNGPGYFNLKGLEPRLPQRLDQAVTSDAAPTALYVFVDAMTCWGGSQFINSEGTGRYEDYIVEDLVPAIRRAFPFASTSAARWCVTGGSSGGYGALHLASRHPGLFGWCAAIAPDSFFEASLLPDIYTALPAIYRVGSVDAIRAEIAAGRFMQRRDAHTILNAIAMGLCYSPGPRGTIEFPIEHETGILRPNVWRTWKMHDPCEFLRVRSDNLLRLSGLYLDVGIRDQYHLHFGARQIRNLLHEQGVPVTYSEFDGTHSDIDERRPLVWKWLNRFSRS